LSGDEETIHESMFSEDLRQSVSTVVTSGVTMPEERDMNRAVDLLKRQMIEQAVEDTGSKTRAAERLGIPRQSLQKMMKRLDMD